MEVSSNPDVYKQNIIKSLCAAAGIPPNAHAPLLDKNLGFLLRHSPAMQGLKPSDFVCTLLTITQLDWDSRMTPVILRWFIREFCAADLPDHSPTHEEGKHKTRVFASALGFTEGIYFVLRDEILSAVLKEAATLTRKISYGVLWQVDFHMTYLNKSATVRTGWIIRNNEDFPRLTTCFVI